MVCNEVADFDLVYVIVVGVVNFDEWIVVIIVDYEYIRVG